MIRKFAKKSPRVLQGKKIFVPLQSQHGAISSVGRAPDCGSGCRGFEPHIAPHRKEDDFHHPPFFCFFPSALFLCFFPSVLSLCFFPAALPLNSFPIVYSFSCLSFLIPFLPCLFFLLLCYYFLSFGVFFRVHSNRLLIFLITAYSALYRWSPSFGAFFSALRFLDAALKALRGTCVSFILRLRVWSRVDEFRVETQSAIQVCQMRSASPDGANSAPSGGTIPLVGLSEHASLSR